MRISGISRIFQKKSLPPRRSNFLSITSNELSNLKNLVLSSSKTLAAELQTKIDGNDTTLSIAMLPVEMGRVKIALLLDKFPFKIDINSNSEIFNCTASEGTFMVASQKSSISMSDFENRFLNAIGLVNIIIDGIRQRGESLSIEPITLKSEDFHHFDYRGSRVTPKPYGQDAEDLLRFYEQKFLQSLMNNFSTKIDSEKVFKEVTRPQIPSSGLLERITDLNITFEMVGGQDDAVETLRKLVQQIANPEKFEKRGVPVPKGILLWGPPGTGKTLLAKALAAEAKAVFLYLNIGELFSKYYSDTTKHVNDVFDEVEGIAEAEGKHAILYIDEIDALAVHRTDSHEETARAVSVMLQRMDGIKSKNNHTVLASTNRADALDPALLRPGRFDQKVYVGKPNSPEARKHIFYIHLRLREQKANEDLFSADCLTDKVLEETNGFSGADIEDLINKIITDATIREEKTGSFVQITEQDFLEKIKEIKGTFEKEVKIGFRSANGK